MSDIMNDVFGRAETEPREGSGTDTIDVERTDAVAPDIDAETVDAETDVENTDSDDRTDDSTEDSTEDATAEADGRPEAEDRGTTTVADVVVSKVVNMVAGKTDGVYRLDDEDSEVVVDGRDATIRIALVVENGHAVTALAKRIRTDVIDAVEQGLGLDVVAVDIHVGDIHTEEAD